MNKPREDLQGPAPVEDSATLDRQHPWLGLASFTEETRSYFHGREEEVAELARRVQRKLLTILFGQSGLGKTSILRAGLVPKLRPEGYCPVYVRIDYSPESPAPSEQIKQAIFRETQATGTWTQSGVAVEGESLWEFLHHRDDVLKDADGRTLVPIVIFDQFEEVFTIAQGDAFGRDRAAQFLADLADLVENRPPRALEARLDEDDSAIDRFDFTRADYRILIALREDYLAHLEGLKGMMPSITQNRMRLARMTGVQALEAVMRPGGRLVSEEVAEAIVRFVAGGAELRNAEVEPALLSLVCRELNNARIAQGRSEISADVLAGSRDTILGEFYERALADQPEAVRKVIEDHLLTESGYRESLAEERLQKLLNEAGAAPGTMGRLVDRRLLRVEERLDVRRVELTHDVLTGVVKASRDVRLEREAREDAERKLAAQREREVATRNALVRARQIAAGCAVLAVLAIGSAIYGYFATERAKAAEAKSEETRLMAEQARGEAEKLVVYLLDDFYLELAPVGRLDIVAALAKRAIDYYSGLPEALRTPQTERNRALALVRYGSVLRTQARLDEGRKAIDEAVTTLSRLREQGDASDLTAIGLALGYSTKARIASSLDADAKALPDSAKAVETLRALASAPEASTAVRRAYGEVLNMHGFLQLRNGEDGTIATLDAARAVYRSIAGLAMTDPSAAASYAETTAWTVEAYMRQDRTADAIRAADEAWTVAGQVLRERPGHMQALRALALGASPLSHGLRLEGRVTEALAMNDRARSAWRELVRADPGNTIAWSNLAVAYFIRGNTLFDMGRLGDAAATFREALMLEREAKRSSTLWTGLSNIAGNLADVEAMRGNAARASEALATAQRLQAWTLTQYSEGTFERSLRSHADEARTCSAVRFMGAFERALPSCQAFAAKLEAVRPPSEAEQAEWVLWLGYAYENAAEAAYALGDYAVAERAIARGQELRKSLTGMLADRETRRTVMNAEAIRAMVLARRGKQADAQAAIGPALEYQRAMAAKGSTSATQDLEHAIALYVAALAGVGDRTAMLADAARRLDGLPPELRTSHLVVPWRLRVAEETRRRPAG